MTYSCALTITANWAAIITAVVAVFAYGIYRYEQIKKRRKLESYLKAEKEACKDHGQRTILHLMAKLGLTEHEILQASFRSKSIVRRIAKDPETGRANALLLEHCD